MMMLSRCSALPGILLETCENWDLPCILMGIVRNVWSAAPGHHPHRRSGEPGRGESLMSGTADYSYRPPGNYGGKPPTQEELRYAFENAPACHHDHGFIARQASQFLAAQEDEGESAVGAAG